MVQTEKTTPPKVRAELLLIDDSELVLRHISALLTTADFRITTAKSMVEGLESFVRKKPQAILTDFVLDSGHTGLELISAIYALSKQTPAAVLTLGSLSAADEQRASQLNVPIIQKPRQGSEQEFLQNVQFWLRDSGVI